MRTGTKLAAFAAAVAVSFGAALAVGAAVGPIDVGADAAHGSPATGAAVAVAPRGLAVAASGHRLVAEAGTVAAGEAITYAFSIVDDEGDAVTDFDVLHERRLHLVVVTRTLGEFLHLHPEMDASGRWSVALPPLAPGSYRVFADFQPAGGGNLTLGTDLLVPGDTAVVALPGPTDISTVGSYEVQLTGSPAVGDAELKFAVELDGRAVATEAYLGAAGHLVAIRSGDLAYLHVHPEDDAAGGDAGGAPAPIVFTATFPTAGTYRLFLEFAHDGVVHTAPFTVVIAEDPAAADGIPTSTAPMAHEGH